MTTITLKGGQRITAHGADLCEGDFCCIHNPSDHHMKDWPQFWRSDAGFMERICPHGIGHPDPDDKTFLLNDEIDVEEAKWARVHGCDGCCRETDPNEKEDTT
jgi:hypothetical protein